MRYLPHTENEIQSMLARIGVPSLDALFEAIPATHRLNQPLPLEPGLDEAALMRHLEDLARKNSGASLLSFLGAGAYDHHIPPALDQLLLRSEFYTAYTPYQPEVSQGTLQAAFEFQTVVADLFGLEVANASLYDGASGTAEAVLMARRLTQRHHCVLSAGVHPEYVAAVRTYLSGLGPATDVELAPLASDGRTDFGAVARLMRSETAAVVVGYPNFFGCVEDVAALAGIAQKRGALVITATSEPYALSLLAPPGALGADIAVGEGQSLAVPPAFGGPGVGLFACRQAHARQIPGRLVGQTTDSTGKRGFVLTLATREQHIRREKATSNICTNHGLVALAFLIRTSLLGRSGFVEAGLGCLRNAEYLKAKLVASAMFETVYSAPTFNEFTVRCKTNVSAAVLARRAEARGVLPGLNLERFDPKRTRELLVATTEKHSRADLDRVAAVLAEAAST